MDSLESLFQQRGSERRSVIIPFSQRFLIGVIADEATVVGFLLAGIGDSNFIKNFIIVDAETNTVDLERSFLALYNRKNMGILLVAKEVFMVLPGLEARLRKMLPIVLQIPTKNIFKEKTLMKKGFYARNDKKSQKTLK